MEILACGIPVIAFAVGGNEDLVIQNWNGYLVSGEEIDPILISLDKLHFPDRYNFFSKNAREHMLANYSKDIIVSKYSQIYDQLLKEG
jgi:glycosyltransferase involved in cell wall biosynthesis